MKNDRPIKVGKVRQVIQHDDEDLHNSLYTVLKVVLPDAENGEDENTYCCKFLSGEYSGEKEWYGEEELSRDIVVM